MLEPPSCSMRDVEAVLTAFAINMASAVFVAGASRVARESLSEEQERDLKEVFDRASAAMLVELARGEVGNRALLGRYEEEFRAFYAAHLTQIRLTEHTHGRFHGFESVQQPE